MLSRFGSFSDINGLSMFAACFPLLCCFFLGVIEKLLKHSTQYGLKDMHLVYGVIVSLYVSKHAFISD